MSQRAPSSCRRAFGAAVIALVAGSCDIPIPTPPFSLQPTVTPSFACNAADAVNRGRQTRVVLRLATLTGFTLAATFSAGGVTATIPAVSLLDAAGREIPLRGVELANPGEMALWVTATADGGRPLAPGDYTVVVRAGERVTTTARGALHVVAPPVIASVSSAEGGAAGRPVACAGGGARLRVSGRGFRAGAVTVALERAGAPPVVLADAAVAVTAPDAMELTLPGGLAPGRYGVRLVARDGARDEAASSPLTAWPQGCEASLPDAFEVVPDPVLTALEEGAPCGAGDLRVVARGAGLREGDVFTLGGDVAVAPDRVELDQPAGDGSFGRATLTVRAARVPGLDPFPVTVRRPGACTASVGPGCPTGATLDALGRCAQRDAGGVSYALPTPSVVGPPRVDAVALPRACAAGPLAVMVRGANLFGRFEAPPRVTLGGLDARAVTADGSTGLLAEFDVTEAWLGAAAERTLQVTTATGCVGEARVTIPVAPVALDAVTPARVCLDDEAPILTLRGAGVGAVGVVTVGGLPAGVARVSADELRVTVPPTVATGAALDVVAGPDDGCGLRRPSVRVDAPARVSSVLATRACADADPVALVLGEGLAADELTLTIDGEPVAPERVTRLSSRALRVALPAATTDGAHELAWRGPGGCGAGRVSFVWSPPTADATIDATPAVTVAAALPARLRLQGTRAASFASFTITGTAGGAVALTEVTPLDADTVLATAVGLPVGGPYAVEAADGRCRSLRAAAVSAIPAAGIALSSLSPAAIARGVPTRVTVTGSGWTAPPRVHLTRAGTVLALGSVALDATRFAFDAPPTLEPGEYTFTVASDASSAAASGTLRVVTRVPRVTAVAPAEVTGERVAFAVFGEGFDAPRVSLRFPAEDVAATRVRWSPHHAVVTLDTALLQRGAYVVRVTNGDGGRADGPALQLGDRAPLCASASPLTTARRDHGLVAVETRDGARHLVAIGGDGGPSTPARDDVECATLDADGVLGPWRAQRHRLPAPRAGLAHAAFAHGGFVYAVGGSDGDGRATDTILRAAVLDTDARPRVRADAVAPEGAGLAAGVWTYRVAAVTGGDAPEELLASEPVAVRCEGRCAVRLRWAPVAGAARYRVFRGVVNGDARDVVAVASAAASAWVDDGSAVPEGSDLAARPLDPGSLGPWRPLAARLAAARSGAAAAIVRGTNGRAAMWVFGGRGDGLRDDVERGPWDGARNTFGPFTTEARRLLRPQQDLAALVVTSDEVPWLATPARVYVLGGRGADGAVAPTESAAVLDDGAPVAWRTHPAAERSGVGAVAARGAVATLGGAGVGAAAACRAPVSLWGMLQPAVCAAADLPVTRQGHGLARVGPWAFLAGGTDGAAAVTNVLRCAP